MFKEIYSFELIREITFRKDDKQSPGEIMIGGIEWDEEKDVWGCKCRITFLHDDVIRLHQVDAMGALRACFKFISGLIASAEKDGVEIWWLEPGDHGGLAWGE